MLAEVERRKLVQALQESGGHKGRAAEQLQLTAKALHIRLKDHGIEA